MTPVNRKPGRRRRLVPLLASVSVVVVLGAAAVIARSTPSPGTSAAADDTVVGLPVAASAAALDARSCTPPTPLTPRRLRVLAHQPVIAPTSSGGSEPARPRLRALAATITASPCDRVVGAYAYVQLRQWVIANTPDTGNAVLQDEHWLAADGSGRSTSVTTREPASENVPRDETFRPGASLVDPIPLSSDPGVLAHRLDSINRLAWGPQSALRALADLNQWQTPDRGVRAAAVAVLRDTDGLTYDDTVTDRAGRPGIAVAATSDNGVTRDLVILDDHTGELLAYEHTALHDPSKLGITGPTVLTYRLYLAHTRTASVQQR